MRTLNRPKPTVDVERRADGTLILSAGRSLPADLPLVIDLLQRAAERRPTVTFLAERRGPRSRLAAADLRRGLGTHRRHRLVADRARLRSRRQADRHPVRQQPRERAAGLRRPARRRACGADLAQLLLVRRLHAPRSRAVGRRARPGLRAGVYALRRRPRPHQGARSSPSTASAAWPSARWPAARSMRRCPSAACTSRPTRRPRSCSPRARPDCPRACSTPTAISRRPPR